MVKEAIHFILVESLQGKAYDAEHIQEWNQSIADAIKNKLKGTITENKVMFMQCHLLFISSLWYSRCIHNSMPNVTICCATEMNYDRYKFVVQVVIGEQKGEGVK